MRASLIIPESTALAARSQVERMTGIEPALSAWEADVLPLNYIRRSRRHHHEMAPTLSLPTYRTGTCTLLAAPLRSLRHGLGSVTRVGVLHRP